MQAIDLELASHFEHLLYVMCNLKQCLHFRFFGVYGGQDSKWTSQCIAMGQRHCLGMYPTEELAAQAYDKMRIYRQTPNLILCGVVHVLTCTSFVSRTHTNRLCVQNSKTSVRTGFRCQELPRSKL